MISRLSTEPIDLALDDLDPEELAAAIHHLSRYDPITYLKVIAAMVGDCDGDD